MDKLLKIKLDDPSRSKTKGTKYEIAVRLIFYQHWEIMRKQMEDNIDAIEKWYSERIQEINKYANEQLEILQNDYIQQRTLFDSARNDYLENAKKYSENKDQQAFNDLKKNCETFVLGIAQLEKIKKQTEYPEIKPVNPTIKRQPKTTSIDDQRRTSGQASTTQGRNTLGRASGQSLMNGIGNETRSTTTMHNNNLANDADTNDDILTNAKCPICLMIFPRKLSREDRIKHADEHQKQNS